MWRSTKHKYNVAPESARTCDNITFDSKAEKARYEQLKLLLQSGYIKDLHLQTKFMVQDKFKVTLKDKKISIRRIDWVVDFDYIDQTTGYKIIEDVKGKRTKEFDIKLKLFLHKYADKIIDWVIDDFWVDRNVYKLYKFVMIRED